MQEITPRGSIAGRLGHAVGSGLAEQIPKEVERYRLSKGLQNLSKTGKDLTPFERFANLSSIPGITPQMIESGSNLLRQEGMSNALKNNKSQKVENPFPKASEKPNTKESPSITTREPIEATLENYIPKTLTELQQRAGQLLEENPQLYQNDPEKAMSAAVTEENQKKSINEAYQTRRGNEQNVQNNIEENLRNQAQALNAKVPGNIYSTIEDKAINSVKPKNQGGEGLTEQQAKKKYGKELDAISRDYESLDSIGNLSMLTRSPGENKRELKSVGKKFKDRKDQENLADTYISKNQLSPGKAYYLAYPVEDVKDLNNEIVKLPKIYQTQSEDPKFETKKISPKIAKVMGKNSSPLAIAEELNSRGYDPLEWLDYVDKNRKELDLTESQARQLDKPRNFFPTLNDNWLFFFSGLDDLVEKK